MVDKKYYTILTEIGKAKIANSAGLGTQVNLTKFQVGDGGGAEYNPVESQTGLKNKVYEGTVNSIMIDENNLNWINIDMIIPATDGGFTVREVAVLDKDGNVILIGKYPETYKPLLENGSIKDLRIKMILEVSNTANITLKVDPTAIFLTKKDEEKIITSISNLDKKITENNTATNKKIDDAKKDLGDKIGDTTLLETTDKTSIVNAVNEVKASVDSIETTAEKTTIKDTDNLFTSDNVEGALKEVMQEVKGNRTSIISSINTNLIPM